MNPIIEVDRVEITSLVDNVTDTLLYDNTEVVRRHWTDPQKGFAAIPLAEHGLSMLVKVVKGEDEFNCLFDAGVTEFPCFITQRRLAWIYRSVTRLSSATVTGTTMGPLSNFFR